MVVPTFSWVLYPKSPLVSHGDREEFHPAFSREREEVIILKYTQNILFSVAKSYPWGKLLYQNLVYAVE